MNEKIIQKHQPETLTEKPNLDNRPIAVKESKCLKQENDRKLLIEFQYLIEYNLFNMIKY